MRTKTNLHMHELVGLKLRVVQSSDGGMVGMEGIVMDETRETLVIAGEGTKTLAKRGSSFEFMLEDGTTVVLEGEEIAFRSEDRTKRAEAHRRKVSRDRPK